MAQLNNSTVNGNLNVTEDVTLGGVSLINELNKLDNKQADYIIEQGTSGIWTYRKWNSGIAECWGKQAVNTSINNNWGTYLVDTPAIVLPSFPFTFADIPIANYSFGGSLAAMIESSNPTTTSGGTTWLTRPAAVPSNSITGNIFMYVVGRWK